MPGAVGRRTHIGDVRLAAMPSGDAGVLVESSGGNAAARRRVIARVRASLLDAPFPGFVDLLASYEHVYVTVDPAIVDTDSAVRATIDAIEASLARPDAPGDDGRATRVITLPVVFGGEHGPDLTEVARHFGITTAEMVARVEATRFTVDFLGTGMQPMCTGDLGGAPVPRRSTPRVRLPSGSVGLAARNLTIYPFDSPGGWQLIGRTPVRLVDIARDPAVEYAAGDVLRLRAIDAADLDTAEVDAEIDAAEVETAEVDADGSDDATRAPASVRQTTASRDIPGGGASAQPRSRRRGGALRVVTAGNVHVQDLGRIGHERNGLGPGGALDQLSAMRVNILVGNPRDAAVLELVATAAEFVAEATALIAVSGAPCDVVVDGVRQPVDTPIVLRRGQSLSIGRIRDGARVYLAIAGELDVPRFAGSAAPDPVVGFSTRLTSGGTVAFSDAPDLLGALDDYRHPVFDVPLFRFSVPRVHRGDVWSIPITPGTDAGRLEEGVEALTATVLEVSPQSDAVGQRLTGAALAQRPAGELVSRGVPIGGVELVPTGELIVLQRSRYITAGYPIVAVVTRDGLTTLGQALPGQRIRFRLQSARDATAAWRRRMSELDDLERRVRAALDAASLRGPARGR